MPDDPQKRGPQERSRTSKQKQEKNYKSVKPRSVAAKRSAEDEKRPGRASKNQGPTVVPDAD